MHIGILALQGAFAKHGEMLCTLGVEPVYVRTPDHLRMCAGLILPGGESTVMSRLLTATHLLEPIQRFAQTHPLFGTCAGLILMSRSFPLNLLDVHVERNAFGRQISSFYANVHLSFTCDPVPGMFIRAPRITEILSPAVTILGSFQQEPVCIQQGHHLACTFHPELTQNPALHHHFVELCKLKQSKIK